MKFKLILCALILGGLTTTVQAQKLSKKEKRALRKEKRALKKEIRTLIKSPVKYKSLKEGLTAKEEKVEEQGQTIAELQRKNSQLEAELTEASTTIENYAKAIHLAKNNTTCRNDNGMKYRVQIGLYKQFDIRSFLNETKVVSFEDINGLYQYTIGNFTTEEEAETFKQAMMKMGIKDAFVSYYLDGKRISKD